MRPRLSGDSLLRYDHLGCAGDSEGRSRCMEHRKERKRILYLDMHGASGAVRKPGTVRTRVNPSSNDVELIGVDAERCDALGVVLDLG